MEWMYWKKKACVNLIKVANWNCTVNYECCWFVAKVKEKWSDLRLICSGKETKTNSHFLNRTQIIQKYFALNKLSLTMLKLKKS